MTSVCLVALLAGCAAEESATRIEFIKAQPIQIPDHLREHCMSTWRLPQPPRPPRTPESVVRWAERVQTSATKALIVCDRRREDLIGLIEVQNEQGAHLTKP